MENEEHEQLADEFDRRADEMEHENAKLSEEIDAVRKDWEAKRADGSVPGAVPRDDDLSSERPDDDPVDQAGQGGAPEREPDDG